MRRLARCDAFAWLIVPVVAVALSSSVPAAFSATDADQGPRPPCGQEPWPNYPPPGGAAAIRVWDRASLDGSWTSPSCIGDRSGGFLALVALAGRFRADGDIDGVLARLGAISSLTGLQYWSIGDQKREVLITHAEALVDAASHKVRPDFSAAELRGGGDLYFLQVENRLSADVVYRLHLESISADRAVVTVANVTPVRFLFVPVLDADDLRSTYFFDRGADGTWKFYSILRVGHGGSIFSGLIRQESYVNRAAALFGHFAGGQKDHALAPARE
jgi:hypothetical protein